MRIVVAQPKEVIAKFVTDSVGGEGFREYTTLGLVEAGSLLAGVVYTDFTRATVNMHVAAVDGKRWLTRDFLFACFDYPFNEMGVRTVVGLVPKKNKQARKFDENLGFHLTGRIPDGMPKDDLLIYTMTREQCRWLGLRAALRKAA